MPDCLFCRIASHQIAVQAVFEDEQFIAFPDINPQAPTHVLVIPKQHFRNIAETPIEVLGGLTNSAAALARRLCPDGFRIVANTGADGGQTVDHLHLHVLGGRPMAWPPG